MQDGEAKPLVVLMHGNRKVSTKNLARQIGAKLVEPCSPEVANRHSGYLVGGTSPFGTRRTMPVYIESSILALPKVLINGGRRGYLIGIDPQLCVSLLGAHPCMHDERREYECKGTPRTSTHGWCRLGGAAANPRLRLGPIAPERARRLVLSPQPTMLPPGACSCPNWLIASVATGRG